MPTIAFVSQKGGAGKTTSAFLLSTALAKLYDVTVIDADPNHPANNRGRLLRRNRGCAPQRSDSSPHCAKIG